LKPVLVLRHAAHVPIGSLEYALDGVGMPWHYVDVFADEPRALPLEAAAGLVILGGPMNADDVEMTPRLIDEWLEEPNFSAEVAALDYIDPAAIRAQMPERIVSMESFSRCLLGRFAAWCGSRKVRL
jgi:hypothetical protein